MQNAREKRVLRLSAILIAFAMMFTAFAFTTNDVYAAAKPAQVKNLKMSASTATSITTKWAKAKNAKQYQVAYKKLGASKFKTKTVSKLTYKVTGLTQDTTYCIKVRGVNGKTYGKWSSVKKFNTKVNYAKAANETKVTVTVTSSKVQIKIGKLGLSGKATVYGMGPNEYLKADAVSGIVTANEAGYKVGTFSMNKAKTLSVARTKNGYDRAYDKFYVVYDGAIVKGPIYATTIPSAGRKVTKTVASKKGIVDELSELSFEVADDLGANWTAMNIDFTQLVLDSDAGASNSAITVNGKTYYMNDRYVGSLDYRLSRYEQMGVNVIGIVISFVDSEVYSNYPDALKYIDDARWTNGFNTSTAEGRDYFIAGMEFLADRYSKGGNGLICNYVIGNEIDYAYDWNEVIPNKGKNLGARGDNRNLRAGETETKAAFDTYMEEYARTLRIANTAVKKYAKDATVSVSLSKEWAKSVGEQNGSKAKSSKKFDSYRPKEIVSWLNYYTKKGGDFNWALTPHHYPIGNGYTGDYETGLGSKKVLITGNPDTTTTITQSNMEVLQLFLNRPVNKFKGTARSIFLTENGSSSGYESGTPSVEAQREHAAAVAQHYYRAASLPSVKAIVYYKITDREAEGATEYKMGLIDTTGQKKLAYDVWKNIDKQKGVADEYLNTISFKKGGKTYKNLKSYKEAMKVVKSDWNWDKNWKF
ncbi:MAG: fibronectin type III domain-containing protein [Firmicutes bacterium]|nr:fibronectin type III domain-containing protein [Bacillota bacterium]